MQMMETPPNCLMDDDVLRAVDKETQNHAIQVDATSEMKSPIKADSHRILSTSAIQLRGFST